MKNNKCYRSKVKLYSIIIFIIYIHFYCFLLFFLYLLLSSQPEHTRLGYFIVSLTSASQVAEFLQKLETRRGLVNEPGYLPTQTLIEFSPHQRVPRRRKARDSKMGTIEQGK